MKRRTALVAFAAALSLSAWSVQAQSSKPLVVGVTVGPHAQISEVAKQVAERNGLAVKLVEFSDFIQPNAALDAGEIDINIYQHKPFLESQNKAKSYRLTPVATTVIQQMGVYSKKHKSLADLPNKATVAIPNDPTNGARALLVLQDAKLIKLKEGVDVNASLFHIVDNPKQLRFVELEAAMLPQSLADVDAAAVNSAYAIPAGLYPAKDALVLESKQAPFAAVVIAARESNKNDPRIAEFVKAYHSPEVKQFVEKQFPGAYTTSW